MKKRISTFLTVLMLSAVSFTIFSCKNEKENLLGEGETTVTLNLIGITEATEGPLQKSSLKGSQNTIAYVTEVPYNKDYTIIASVTPDIPAEKINGQSTLNRSSWTTTPQPAITNSIAADVKYLVMVFDENGNRIFAQEKVYDSHTQSLVANQMTLNAGKKYTFVAVSNNTSTAPVFNTSATTLSDVTNRIAVNHTTDYLYFNSGQVNIVYGQQNYINITFKHINSRISLNLDATAEMGHITAISANVTGSGSVNLAANGTVTSASSAAYNKAFVFQELDKQNITSNYVLLSSAGNAHNINITSVSINGSPERTNIPAISIPAGALQKGASYKISLSFQATGIVTGGLVWARGNLAYDWTNNIYYNRYYPQETGSDYKDFDYWNYATNQANPLVPKMIITGYSDLWNNPNNVYYFTDGTNENSISKIPLNDPCKKIAGGKWRMPSLHDFQNLGVYKVHNGGDINGTTDGLPLTTLAGGTVHPNGNITDNNFPYVYFDGVNEITGGSVRLRFYKTGRYYGNVTQVDHDNGPQNGGNIAYIANAAVYMASDAYNYETGTLYRRPYMPAVFNNDASGGTNTFITRRKDLYNDWSADDRVPVRCVKNL